MSIITRPWSRMTLAGKIILPLLLLFVLLNILIVAGQMTGVLPVLVNGLFQVINDNVDIFRFIGAVTALLLFTVPAAFVIIFMEMKLIAFINLRLGPNRQGPWGVLSSTLHGFKVLAKEDFTPTGADVPVFTLAPVVTYLGAVMTIMVIPFAPGLFGLDMNLGLLYFFAVAGLGVIGLMMGGWSSFNKYSLLGGLRAAAAIISYEIPLTLAVVGVIMLTGTMSLNAIVLRQSGSFIDWFAFQQPLAFIIFFIAATAEGGRTPFDLTEADSEIVAGFATEYSGMRFGFFFFAEYVNLFILSALMVTLFLGGWNAPLDIQPLLDWLHITVNSAIDPGSLGIGLLWIILLVPPLAILAVTLPIWMIKSKWSFLKAFIVGFVIVNVIGGAILAVWAYITFPFVAGLFWFFGKAFTMVALFVIMRGTLPRVRIDELMGFAWKWLIPAALLNLFVTAGALLVLQAR